MKATRSARKTERRLWPAFFAVAAAAYSLVALQAGTPMAQVEIAPSLNSGNAWVAFGSVEGHLSLEFSPSAAFSPDSSTLAVANQDRVLLMNLHNSSAVKVVTPHFPELADLEVQSASFLDADKLFVLATGIVHPKGKPSTATPLLGFQWDIAQDAVAGRLDMFGAGGGYGRPRYFPDLRYLGIYKDSSFTLWSPMTQQAVAIKIPDLTREPRLYSFSPDGHWLLLAQVAGGGSPDPIVVRLSEHKLVNSLPGHLGTVMSMVFSRDSQKVATTCEDGKIRIWSVGNWKLLETLVGHEGPVHWAEFSPDGQWLASAGEDQTVRVWSVKDGKLLQTLKESPAPVLTVAFSPNNNYLAASTERSVLIWQKSATGP